MAGGLPPRRHRSLTLRLAPAPAHLLPVAALLAAALAAGCGGDEVHPIVLKRTLDQPRPEQNVAADTLQRLTSPPRQDPHAHHEGDGHDHGPPGLAWDLPAGWKEIAPAQFRDGNFVVPGRDGLECYVTILPGGGGGVLANVNRWRQQLGQPAVSERDVAALPKLTVLGIESPFVLIDGVLASAPGGGAGSSMAATVAAVEGAAVTVKMVGRTEDVVAEIANFKALCASLRPSGPKAQSGPDPGSAAPPPASDLDPAAIRWTVPAGWSEGAARPMRLVTVAPEGVQGVECYVTILRGGGSVADNVNRWRGQVGLPALGPGELAALPKADVLGKPSPLLEAEGAKDAIYGVICDLGAHQLFVKMTGTSEALRAERERFLAFCGSLRR